MTIINSISIISLDFSQLLSLFHFDDCSSGCNNYESYDDDDIDDDEDDADSEDDNDDDD